MAQSRHQDQDPESGNDVGNGTRYSPVLTVPGAVIREGVLKAIPKEVWE